VLLEMTEDQILESMRRQHKEFEREGYDGHNRRSGLTTMRRISLRCWRRTWNRRMMHLAHSWA
jgi:hypothetical protein